MVSSTQKKDAAFEPHGKSQFCLPSMDEMACFQDCELGPDDDDFVDLEDNPQVAQHWLENFGMIEKETNVSEDWSDDLSFFFWDSSIEELEPIEPELIPLCFVHPLCHSQSHIACWTITFICSALMCVDFNSLTLCMSLLQAMFISMQKSQLILNLMTEHLRQDSCVNDGFKCHPACLMVSLCLMMIV